MAKVTKKSLAENIKRLESWEHLSMNEEHQLEAYRMLLSFMVGDVVADDLIRSKNSD